MNTCSSFSTEVSDVARPLIDDGAPDVAGYNAELEEQKGLTWLSATMLYSECYMYRSVDLTHPEFFLD